MNDTKFLLIFVLIFIELTCGHNIYREAPKIIAKSIIRFLR